MYGIICMEQQQPGNAYLLRQINTFINKSNIFKQ